MRPETVAAYSYKRPQSIVALRVSTLLHLDPRNYPNYDAFHNNMSFTAKYDDLGNPLVQHAFVENFQLRSGEVIQKARLGYCVFGEDPSNPIIILHPALTGSPKAWTAGKQSQGDGWWTHCIGPGNFLDTKHFTIVCVDHFGGNGDSSSAKELELHKKDIEFADGTILVAEVLRDKGIKQIFAAVGGSIGGGQVFAWLFQDKVKVNRLLDISGSASQNLLAEEFFQIQAELLWEEGKNIAEILVRLEDNTKNLLGQSRAFDDLFDYLIQKLKNLETSFTALHALELTRAIGFLRFLTPSFFENKYQQFAKKDSSKEYCRKELRSWIDHQGKIFPARFSLEALAELCFMNANSQRKTPKEIAERIDETNTKIFGFSVIGDVLFDAEQNKHFYQRIKTNLPDEKQNLVEIVLIEDKLYGHDHFLTEQFIETSKLLRPWLAVA